MKITITILACLISVTAFSQAPKPEWAAFFEDTAKGTPQENDMATDAAGNTFITGYFTISGDYVTKKYFLIKRDSSGILQWAKYFPQDSSAVAKNNMGKAVTTDAKGNVYVTGVIYDTLCNICTVPTPHQDLFVIKYKTDGTISWIYKYAGKDSTYQNPEDITTDSKGNVYITGNEQKLNTHTYTFIPSNLTQKITNTGVKAWSKILPLAFGHGITLDKDDNVIVAAAYDPNNIYQLQENQVVKFNNKGDTLWTRVFHEAGKYGQNYFVATDAKGNIYANGQTDTNAFFNNPRVITIKYSADGNFVWQYKDSSYTRTTPNIFGDFKVDAKGNTYIAATISDASFQTRKWIVSKYNTNGKKVWNDVYGGVNFSSFYPCGIVVDGSGNVYAAGVSYIQNPKYYYSFTTIKYDAAGTRQWVAFYPTHGTNNYGFPSAIGIDAGNNIYVSGLDGMLDKTQNKIVSKNCTVKYKGISAATFEQIVQNKNISIAVYPNPCSNILFVKNTNIHQIATMQIVDASGNTVLKNNMPASANNTYQINVATLKPGMYILNIINGENTYTQKFIKQ